ncbi:hypothetical protein [Candidatus Liberibacter asiaticus]|nr:hypothetical protein [Candidatus Liberibacter asiaticus]
MAGGPVSLGDTVGLHDQLSFAALQVIEINGCFSYCCVRMSTNTLLPIDQ